MSIETPRLGHAYKVLARCYIRTFLVHSTTIRHGNLHYVCEDVDTREVKIVKANATTKFLEEIELTPTIQSVE